MPLFKAVLSVELLAGEQGEAQNLAAEMVASLRAGPECVDAQVQEVEQLTEDDPTPEPQLEPAPEVEPLAVHARAITRAWKGYRNASRR